MKIYVITKGSYSDYHICAVTTDEKQAEKLAKLYTDNWDDAEVEEYETDDYTDELKDFNDSRLPYRVTFTFVGDVHRVSRQGLEDFEPRVDVIQTGDVIRLKDAYISVQLYAPDEEAAVKIAAEKRAEFLAIKSGI